MKYIPGVALLVVALALALPARADHARFGPVLTVDAEYARTLMERGGVAPIDLRSGVRTIFAGASVVSTFAVRVCLFPTKPRASSCMRSR